MRHQRRDASFTVITNNHNGLLFPHDNEKAPLRAPHVTLFTAHRQAGALRFALRQFEDGNRPGRQRD